MSRDFYRQLGQALAQGAIVVATVTKVKGSVPREVGAKMMISAEGRTVGTIGGGAGEAKVIQQAQTLLKAGGKQFVEIDLSGVPYRETQGVCGGWMQVWLERWSGQEAIALAQQVLDLLESGQSGLLITPFHSNWSPYLMNELPAEATVPEVRILDISSQTEALFEPLLHPPTCLVIGAGHVAVPLAQMAHILGFQTIVQDDRSEFARADRFPAETIVSADTIEALLPMLPVPAQLYVILVTRGYQHDLDALGLLLQQPVLPRYVGMIGSEKRVHLVMQTLLQQGISATQLSQVYAPIGLDIGALTPEEIAVSICAELVQVYRGGTGRSLSANRRKALSSATAEQLSQCASRLVSPDDLQTSQQ